MKKILTLFTILTSVILFTNCEKNDDTPAITEINYVGLESDFQVGVDPNGSATEEVTIATSQTSSSDRTFNLAVDTDLTTADPSAYSVPASVTVPANSNIGTFNIEVIGPNVDPSGLDILAIGFTSEDDNLSVSDPISLNLKQVCPVNELTLEIIFDSYPEEIYWIFYDDAGNFEEESAPSAWGAYTGLTGGITQTFCIPDGTYTFEIYDFYSDGICCNYGQGSYSLTGGGNVYASGGNYGAGEATTFTLGD
jgi:hypothetical protein